MDVTVPEAGNDGLSAAIDDARVFRDLDFAAAADRVDDATGDYNDRIGERGGVRRSVDAAACENECLRMCGSAAKGSPAEKEHGERNAKPIPDHRRSLECCMSTAPDIEERRVEPNAN
jgi:hypothetical protein